MFKKTRKKEEGRSKEKKKAKRENEETKAKQEKKAFKNKTLKRNQLTLFLFFFWRREICKQFLKINKCIGRRFLLSFFFFCLFFLFFFSFWLFGKGRINYSKNVEFLKNFIVCYLSPKEKRKNDFVNCQCVISGEKKNK